MDMTIAKWGNSLGVRIPGALAKSLGLAEGTSVRLAARRGRLVVEPVMPEKYELQELLARITPKNIHGSVETGQPAGREIW
jgi:antitoxin MazE